MVASEKRPQSHVPACLAFVYSVILAMIILWCGYLTMQGHYQSNDVTTVQQQMQSLTDRIDGVENPLALSAGIDPLDPEGDPEVDDPELEPVHRFKRNNRKSGRRGNRRKSTNIKEVTHVQQIMGSHTVSINVRTHVHILTGHSMIYYVFFVIHIL